MINSYYFLVLSSLFIIVVVYIAYIEKILTSDGAISTMLFGLIDNFVGGFQYIVIFIAFVFTAYIVTKYQFTLKKAIGIQEGSGGERGWKSVTSHIFIPTVVIVLHYLLHFLDTTLFIMLFSTSMGFAMSDALASEMGVISNETYSIIRFVKVPTGINGGISILGEVWAFLGSAFIVFFTLLVIFISGMPITSLLYVTLIPIVLGFLGCQIDSVLGELVENKGYIDKFSNNFISMASSTIIAYVVYYFIR